ncbi:hypothetical protein RhoFasGS6_01425 [Rhodococcus fascians]|nr:hypothetical protein ASH04_13495 [Rhodococcus sp. Leaf233]NIL84065.1 hypothetical protein [Rhodococcus fascians]CAH0127066.1 hypothetical protein SRABI91_00111 [Rhodococcus fascians]
MVDDLSRQEKLLVIVDRPRNIGALPVVVACDCGIDVAYLPGQRMRRFTDLYPGNGKTDANDAFIADAARTLPMFSPLGPCRRWGWRCRSDRSIDTGREGQDRNGFGHAVASLAVTFGCATITAMNAATDIPKPCDNAAPLRPPSSHALGSSSRK